ncbi:MAG: hypothetical protein KatS3mg126_0921 [Lysobacteraceae bacterium]|nr:MAG: hypothetical protein KatS3mg126_0921 [Xanthomonadaceae bacterium]
MSRRAAFDAMVVGGGMVGATAALALAEEGLDVALAEPRPPPAWAGPRSDLRVVALAEDAMGLLRELAVWPEVVAHACAYTGMEVWDAGSEHRLRFSAAEEGRPTLGAIVENALLVDRLWSRLRAHPRVSLLEGFALERLDPPAADADAVKVTAADGTSVRTRLLVAADGAASPTRARLGVEVDRNDYGQSGLVAFVDTELPHARSCYQRFLPSGPLAFLPLRDGGCSIVWTLPREEAARLADLPPPAFEDALERAFASRLGAVRLASPRRAFPLARQLARRPAVGRAAAGGRRCPRRPPAGRAGRQPRPARRARAARARAPPCRRSRSPAASGPARRACCAAGIRWPPTPSRRSCADSPTTPCSRPCCVGRCSVRRSMSRA